MTGGALLDENVGEFRGNVVQLDGGSRITSGLTTLDSNFGPSMLDGASTWTVNGPFKTINAYALTLTGGSTLTSSTGLTTHSAGVTIEEGSAWQIADDATIQSSTGTSGGLQVERGGVSTIGGNLFVNNGGVVFANYASTVGDSHIDVTGRVDLASAGQVFVGQGANVTSAGLVSRASAFDDGGAVVGADVTVQGTWTDTGSVVIGESGQNSSSTANSLTLNNGGKLTTPGNLTIGQGAAFNSFIAGNNSMISNLNGLLAQNAGSQTTASVFGTWTNSGTLTVADGGAATLAIGNSSGAVGAVTSGAATVGNQAGSNGFVDIEGGGKWTVNGNLVIGAAGMSVGRVAAGFGGHLMVSGSMITLGRDAGSIGTLSLDDAFGHGSQLDFTGDLEVGRAGKGTLEVLDGFQLDQGAKTLVLGGQATANGTLRVSDDYAQFGFPAATQTLYKSTNLTIGSLGTGTLTVENNGSVQTTGDAFLGEMAGGTGMATITGTGSKWRVDGSIVIGKNGNFLPDRASHMTIADGGALTVNGQFLTIGQEPGSVGTLTIDGFGSKFMGGATTALEIGRFGAGTLELLNGAGVNLASVTLGTQNGGQGTVKVDGVTDGHPSTFVSLGSITVGGVAYGVGELDITNGGHLSSTGKAIIGRDADSTGMVTLSDAGSDWNLVAGPSGAAGDLTIGQSGTGELTVASQAVLTTGALMLGQNAGSDGTLSILYGTGATAAKVTVDSTLTVGGAGKGNIIVSGGAQLVTMREATLGTQADSEGSIRLLGEGTAWTLSGQALTVGQEGTGKLEVRDKARLVDTAAIVAAGLLHGGDGSVVVDGAGSLLQVKTLGLGGDGDGTLSITNGGKVIADGLVTGSNDGSGSVEVGGSGSTLEIKDLSLGQAKAGPFASSAISIFAGGKATISGLGDNATIEVAIDDTSNPNAPDVSVLGSDSLLTVTANKLRIGNDIEQGSMDVSGGGTVSAVNLSIGDGSRVDVSGNSNLMTTGRLEVGTFGSNGNGRLEVSEISRVVAPGVLVTGQLNVHGSGTTLTANGGAFDLESGLDVGRGTVAVSDGGKVDVSGSLFVGLNGTSSVTVAGAGTQLHAADATLGGFFDNGGLSTSDGGYVSIGSSLTVSGNGTLSTAAGGSVDIGPALFDQAPSGQIRVGALGRLKVNGSVTGTVFNFGGIVGGSGTINGTLINAGVVAPGDPQTLSIQGDYEQMGGGTLELVIAGLDALRQDHLSITGSLSLLDGAQLKLEFIDGFAPKTGDRFDLIDFGTLDPAANHFSIVDIEGLEPGFQFTLGQDGAGKFALTALNDGISNVPEPRAILLVETGLAILAMERRRKLARAA